MLTALHVLKSVSLLQIHSNEWQVWTWTQIQVHVHVCVTNTKILYVWIILNHVWILISSQVREQKFGGIYNKLTATNSIKRGLMAILLCWVVQVVLSDKQTFSIGGLKISGILPLPDIFTGVIVLSFSG